MIEIAPAARVGDIVAHDRRLATVFARHGIDFCCGGTLSVEDACRLHALDTASILRELGTYEPPQDADDPSQWPLAAVLDRIVNGHHPYVREQGPIIQGFLRKLESRHGQSEPRFAALARAFDRLVDDLRQHMAKEELILFPFVRALMYAEEKHERAPHPPFGTIRHPVDMMEREHEAAAAVLRRIRELADQYQAPPTACETWRACYAALADFDADLQAHVHLENHVLFPAAARLEAVLS